MMKRIFVLLAVVLSLSGARVSMAHDGEDHGASEQVVILHGIARSASHMEPLAEYLDAQGYQVFNLDYPSTEQKLEELVDGVQAQLDAKLDPDRRVHFVGYSMGGLVVRAVLNKQRPENLGRVVQLASPNKGSEVADLVQNNWLYQMIFGPAGQQLTTDQTGLGDVLGKVDYELGVIAGNSTIDPASSYVIPGDDDGKVSIKSTRVEGMKAHLIVPASHTFFPAYEIVHKQTAYFLKHGNFE